MIKLDLNDHWKLRFAPLNYSGLEAALSLAEGEDFSPSRPLPTQKTLVSPWFPARLPCDVHTPLIEAGILREPLEGLNSFDSEWIEGKSWWFMRTFPVDGGLLKRERVELVLDYADLRSEVYLNGRFLGTHESVHFPFVAQVGPLLREGDNTLIIRLSTGTEGVDAVSAAPYAPSVDKTYRRGDERRVFLRKPQYVFGWDWGPRCVTCGICGDAYLRAGDGAVIRSADFRTRNIHFGSSAARAELSVHAELENLDPAATREAVVTAVLSLDGAVVARRTEECLLRSGINFLDLDFAVEDAQLWWPNGMGPQRLYDLNLEVSCGAACDKIGPLRVGVRTLVLNTDRVSDGERLFALEVNGTKVFCKGGDWIPADAIYARVSRDKYRTLLTEAKEANFSMLRIWGGGIYEKDLFYELCDELGILVWQDFMFACACYPDEDRRFMDLVSRELSYQVRRLRAHPCLALWCGNNENQWIWDFQWRHSTEAFGGSRIYDFLAPETVRLLSPGIPYWNSSPYGGAEPNSMALGDRHHWHDCTMNPAMEKRITPEEYDKADAKFISEYGYIGPCSMETIRRYHAGAPVERHSELWNWHNNTFEKDTVVAGITKHYIDAEGLGLEDYLLYAGLCQGLMYGYSLESLRSKEQCWGGLFWMYDDCWGEVGWTIIDYYLDRKPSYYYVKRALSPRKLILRERGGDVIVTGINETAEDCSFTLEYGYLSFDGTARSTEKLALTLGARSRGAVHRFPKPDGDLRRGLVFAAPAEGAVPDAALLRSGVFRDLAVPPAEPRISDFTNDGQGNAAFSVESPVYAHGVRILGVSGRLSDDYFDLLPGRSRRIQVAGASSALNASDVRVAAVQAGSDAS